MKLQRRQYCRLSRGSTTKTGLLIALSILAFVFLGWIALQMRPEAKRSNSSEVIIRVYCAAGVSKPVETSIAEYRKAYGVRVGMARKGGSGELAGQIDTEFQSGVKRGADIYITADDSLLEVAHRNGIVAEQIPLAIQRPVIAVRTNHKIQVSSLADLIKSDDLAYGFASEGAAVGKMARRIAKRDGLEQDLVSNSKMQAENVMVLAQALVSGSLDAAIIWDTTVSQINQQHSQPVLEVSALADPQDKSQSNIALGVLTTTENETEALKFARYLSAADKGLLSFREFGFETVDGDHWEEMPEVHLYLGSMFTPVLEEKVREFARREGVTIYPRWEGCGKLVASMRSIQDPDLFPDAYLACDQQFLDKVQEYFEPSITVSSNDIVMAVSPETKHTIESPNDLLNGELKIGICDSTQSALGHLTKQLFSREPFVGLYDKLHQQAAVVVDVGPTLVSQLAAGGLDVAIVYRSNVTADERLKNRLRIVEIDDQGMGTALATQPWAISKATKHRQLMERLFQMIISADSKATFEETGFQWQFQSQSSPAAK